MNKTEQIKIVVKVGTNACAAIWYYVKFAKQSSNACFSF